MMHGKWNVDRLCTEELCVSSCPHGPEACRKRSPCSSAPCWTQREDCHSSRTSFLKVAALLNITTSADTTVEVLKSQISPMVKELLSKPIPHPKSQSVHPASSVPMPVRRAEMLEAADDRLLLGQEFWQVLAIRVDRDGGPA